MIFVDWLKALKRRLLRAYRKWLPAHQFSFSTVRESHKSPHNFIINRKNFLEELGDKYMPSKRRHNYLPYYWMHFRDIHLQVKNIMEIGVQTDKSMKMWEEFFPNAIIYGVDIDPKCKTIEGGRRKIRIGDQSDENFLNKVVEEAGGSFDIIIDDGSHKIEHQLKSFECLFPNLSEHGIYVVEDTGGCVGDYELKTVNSFKSLIDSIMYWPDKFPPKDWPYLSKFSEDVDWINKNIIGVAFYRWIVFVMRGRNPADNQYLSELPNQE